MKTPVIIAIDEGTTNAKAVCVSTSGSILSKGAIGLILSHPQAAWSEQDPNEILLAVASAISQALAPLTDVEIKGIAISNQRESVVVWDRESGRALTPLVSWQCRRSTDFCATLAEKPLAATVHYKSGLTIDPLFPAAKIKLLLESLPDGMQRAENGELCVGTVDTWLTWWITGGSTFVTDYSNASRTQLFNIHTLQWDSELLAIFSIPMACLPEVVRSACAAGESKGFAPLPDGVPILSRIGDSHAALYGQGGFIPGSIKATYGTGSSLMTPVKALRDLADARLARTVAWDDGELTYAYEGNITHTGAAVGWMAGILNITDMTEFSELAQSCESNKGTYFVPALSGLGAPHWNTQARGLITGLTDAVDRATLARASLEAIAYQVADVFHATEELSGASLKCLLVDGGPTRNRWLMQFQADLLQREILCSQTEEVSALGAALLAGRVLGWWTSQEEIATLTPATTLIEPRPFSPVMQDTYAEWQNAVQRTLMTSAASS